MSDILIYQPKGRARSGEARGGAHCLPSEGCGCDCGLFCECQCECDCDCDCDCGCGCGCDCGCDICSD